MDLPEPGLNQTEPIPPEPVPGPMSWPEPIPDWKKATETWGLAWELHVYPFGGMWAIAVMYYAIFFGKSIYQTIQSGSNRRPFIMLSLQLLIHALSRCPVLLLNPYGSKSSNETMIVAIVMIWSLGTAGLTSAFGVLLLILLDATKLKLAPPKFQNLGVLIVITSIHFLVVILSDIVVAVYRSGKFLILVCEVLFGAWGVLVTVGYFVVATRTKRNLTATFQQDFASRVNNNGQGQRRDFKKLRRLVLKCYASSFLGFCIFGLNLYAVTFGPNSVFVDAADIDVWKWWAFQTTFRVLEVLMNVLIVGVALGTTRAPNETA